MPKAGDSYIVVIKLPHKKWGTYRNPTNRNRIVGEGYIPIPQCRAKSFNIFNSNGCPSGKDTLGLNLFNCKSKDGLFSGILKAQGSSQAGDEYAKQFAQQGNLKGLGSWYKSIGAKMGRQVSITWTSQYDMEIEYL